MIHEDPFAPYLARREIRHAISQAVGELETTHYGSVLWICLTCGHSRPPRPREKTPAHCRACGQPMLYTPKTFIQRHEEP